MTTVSWRSFSIGIVVVTSLIFIIVVTIRATKSTSDNAINTNVMTYTQNRGRVNSSDPPKTAVSPTISVSTTAKMDGVKEETEPEKPQLYPTADPQDFDEPAVVKDQIVRVNVEKSSVPPFKGKGGAVVSKGKGDGCRSQWEKCLKKTDCCSPLHCEKLDMTAMNPKLIKGFVCTIATPTPSNSTSFLNAK